jgi:putative spermidine/putrescine transport system permease protein
VITGIALQSSFAVAGVPFSLWTIMIGHATFCIVIVFNNVIARLRRMQPSIEDASMDLGANGLQTFLYVLLPELRSALVAGALLAFALSWDEVIVTIFTAGGNTTIPIWIWTGLRTGGSGSEINVVAAVVVLLSIVPVYFAQRLTTGGADGRSPAEEPGTLVAVAGSQSA